MPGDLELPAITQGLDELLAGLAVNPAAPPDVLLRLTAANISKSDLAMRADLPVDAAAALAGDPDASVRQWLAWNPSLPAEVQAVLAVDADPLVRATLAEEKYLRTPDRFPEPLTREVYELLARDPEPKVRRTLASHWQLPEDLRAALLDDADPRTAYIAATDWYPTPAAWIGDLLARITDVPNRERLLWYLDGPLPAEMAHAVLADMESAPDDWQAARLLRQVAKVADLDADLASRFLMSLDTRAAVAANPTLPARDVAALAHDPDNQVRAAVAARRDLDPVLRESIAVDYDDKSTEGVDWLLSGDVPESDLAGFTRSRHQVFRKTVAMRPGLPDEIVELLAGDESFAVRLFICERQQDAPGWLLAQTAATWTGRSRWTMLRHKNFPADAAARLARSDNRHDRVGAAAHPGLPADVIEALLTDDDAAVRRRAATNRVIPVSRLIELLGAADPAAASGAAANRALPAEAMRQLLDRAAL